MNLYTIFTPALAAKLVRRGFEIVKTAPNKKNPNFIVFYFENTIDFQIALQKLLEK